MCIEWGKEKFSPVLLFSAQAQINLCGSVWMCVFLLCLEERGTTLSKIGHLFHLCQMEMLWLCQIENVSISNSLLILKDSLICNFDCLWHSWQLFLQPVTFYSLPLIFYISGALLLVQDPLPNCTVYHSNRRICKIVFLRLRLIKFIFVVRLVLLLLFPRQIQGFDYSLHLRLQFLIGVSNKLEDKSPYYSYNTR